ncbi:MAG: carbohydrate-binding family 9-like protein [Oscillospiraceae bacterium]|nr:carbohydrate-binding family 9-like protein [Oscillospiraceae bacterium]
MKTYLIRPGSRRQLPEMEVAVMDLPLWGGSAGVSAAAQLCYDDTALYVRLQASEREIRAENTEVWQEPCEDSCLEFFFSPMPGDLRYFNVEFNPNGLMFLGLGTGIPDLVRLWPLQEDVFRFESRRTQGGWEISYAIPHAFVRRFFPGYAPAAGAELRGNFYKCGDKTAQPHYLVWNPIPEEKHTFHSPVDFGRLIFG